MPKVMHIDDLDRQLVVWKIEESIDFFLENLNFSTNQQQIFSKIKHEKRKLEWLASRFALQEINKEIKIGKDEFGNPFPLDLEGDISISHCKEFACAACSKNQIGIDIEPVHDKIQRIAPKFLTEEEFAFIDEDNKTEHLLKCWTIKEAIYKWYGKKSLAFKERIQICPFSLTESRVNVKLKLPNDCYSLQVQLTSIENCILAYTL